jgi:hypothetical protein
MITTIRTRVDLALLNVLPIPLTNARTASVGKDDTTSTLKGVDQTVTSDRGTDLLRSGGNSEFALEVETVIRSLLDDRGRAGHVLIGRVGARADETDFKLVGPAILLNLCSKLGDRGGQIGSERTVDMRFELGKVLKITSIGFQKSILGKLTISTCWSYSAPSSAFKL